MMDTVIRFSERAGATSGGEADGISFEWLKSGENEDGFDAADPVKSNEE